MRLACIIGLMILFLAPLSADATSNRQLEKELREITSAPEYEWLRRPTGPEDPQAPPSGTGGSAGGPRGKFERDAGGCDFEPTFQDAPDAPSDGGCGSAPSPDCSCAPDFGRCDGAVPGHCGNCAAGAAGWSTGGWILGALLLCMVVFVLVRHLLGRREVPDAVAAAAVMEEEVRVSRVDAVEPDSLLARGFAYADEGDFRRAVWCAYLSGISMLARKGFVDLDRATSNWTIVRMTKKRNGPHQATARLISRFEELFFGDVPPTPEHWETCRQILEVDFASLREEAP
jgi:hypothetical protein